MRSAEMRPCLSYLRRGARVPQAPSGVWTFTRRNYAAAIRARWGDGEAITGVWTFWRRCRRHPTAIRGLSAATLPVFVREEGSIPKGSQSHASVIPSGSDFFVLRLYPGVSLRSEVGCLCFDGFAMLAPPAWCSGAAGTLFPVSALRIKTTPPVLPRKKGPIPSRSEAGTVSRQAAPKGRAQRGNGSQSHVIPSGSAFLVLRLYPGAGLVGRVGLRGELLKCLYARDHDEACPRGL